MVEHRSNVHFREKTLLKAARMGHLDQTIRERLRSKEDNVNARDPHTGATVLHDAVRGGNMEIVEFLIRHGAHVNAVDNQMRSPLHDAVARGRLDLVKLLLHKGGDPNLMDSKRCIPFDELARHFGDVQKIGAELRRYGSFPRKCFYEGLFSPPKRTGDIQAWFERLVRSIRDVYHCKIFFTITTAGIFLRLLEPSRSEELISEALFEAVKYCKTTQSKLVLTQLNEHADKEEMAPSSVTDLVNDFLDRTKFKHTTDDTFSRSIRAGIRNVDGVDGRPLSIVNSLVFYRQAYERIKHWPLRNPEIDPHNRRGDDNIDITRMKALICIVGSVINALLRDQTSDPEMHVVVSRAVDFLDKNHLLRINGSGSLDHGIRCGETFVRDPRRQIEPSDLSNGARIIGFCAGALNQMDERPESFGTESIGSRSMGSLSRKSLSSRASKSTSCSVRSFRSISTNASLIFRDAFLSPQDDVEGRLPLHRAIVHRDFPGLFDALNNNTVDLNEGDSAGRSALDLAALTGQEDFFEILEGRGAQSLRLDSVEALKYILQVRAPNKEDYFGFMSLRNTSGSDSSEAGDGDDRSLVRGGTE